MTDGTTSAANAAKLEKQLRVLQRKLERSEWHRVDLENQHDRDQHLYRRLQADLEAAHREAQIEAALERVRSRAMSMRTPRDLSDISETIFTELKALGFADLRNTEIIINHEAGSFVTSYYYSDYGVSGVIDIDYRTNPIVDAWAREMQTADDAFSEVVIREDEIEEWRYYRLSLGYAPDPKLDAASVVYHYSYSIGLGALSISSFEPVAAEQLDVLAQFRNVFHLAYQRYADIARAEAQAREAQIQLALERVRTQSMLMQHSSELVATSAVFHEQLLALGIPSEFSYVWLPDEAAGKHQFWATWTTEEDGGPVHRSSAVTHDLDKEEPYTAACFAAWESDEQLLVDFIQPGDIHNWKELLGNAEHLSPERYPDGLYYAEGYMAYGCFGINIRREPAEEERDILRRFAVEFERAYTRFLDLRRAEAQAREAQIEAALERVRARSMAMHHTSEIQEVIHTVHDELLKLNLSIRGGSFIVINDDVDTELLCWGAGGTAHTSELVHVPHFGKSFCTNLIDGIKKGPGFFTEEFTKKEKREYFTELFKHHPWSELSSEQKKETLDIEGGYTRSCCVSKHTSILIINQSGGKFSDEENNILKRFSKVFEQSYTRFLDLQRAEEQAREAQIEAAMERVRSCALAMTTSDELLDVVFKIHQEYAGLGLPCEQFWHTRYTPEVYQKALTGVGGEKLAAVMELPRDFSSQPALAAWERGDEKIGVFMFDADAACTYLHHMITKGHFDEVDPEGITEEMVRENGGFTFVQARTSHGEIGYTLWGETEPSDEAKDVLIRFTSAFDLANRRFEDLKQAEQQAALDRVRAEIASTLTSDADVTGAIFDPLEAEIRTLFGRSDLRLGLATLQADGGLNVRPGRPVWNSLVIRDALSGGRLDWRGTLYETAMQSAEAIAVPDVESDGSLDEGLREHLLSQGVRSLALQPLRTADRTVGLFELSSSESGAVDDSTLLTMTRLESTFALAVTQNLEGFETRVESALQHAYTAIHPSVRWRFRDAAIDILERGDDTVEPEPVVFEAVHPLYGAADIRASTHHRNEAVRHDVLGRLGRARDALAAIHEALPLTILDELSLRVRKRIEQFERAWNAGDEAAADRFLTEDVEPVLERMTAGRADLVAILEACRSRGEEGGVLRSDAYEASRRAINRAVSDVLLAEEAETQRLFPHYLELTRTDGVEHTMYIGPSIAPDRPFDLAYVENLRLRQLIAACAVAREVRSLGETLPMPLAIAQFVVVQHAPITLRFRADEKRFDVDSPSGVRFELLKKRLDKACVKGTEERITQPDRIAVVYSTDAEEAEYRRYAEYLAAQEHIEPEPEELEVEDLPGAAGLRMLQLKVKSTTS